MPDITERFEIDQPPDAVWAYMQDVPALVTCIPGLELTGAEPPTYRGKVRLRLGPVVAAFEGEATIVEADQAARRARIEGQGLDRQGGSRASAAVAYALSPSAKGTEVSVTADIKLTGALAQIGRTGIVQDVARELTNAFATNLRDKLAARSADAKAELAATTRPTPVATTVSAAGPSLGAGFLLRILMRRLCALFGRLIGRRG
jgi:carbon monoxide dehydrogenase subunit G